jgi:hypothetical protein
LVRVSVYFAEKPEGRCRGEWVFATRVREGVAREAARGWKRVIYGNEKGERGLRLERRGRRERGLQRQEIGRGKENKKRKREWLVLSPGRERKIIGPIR